MSTRREATAESPRKRDVRAIADAALEALGESMPATRGDVDELIGRLAAKRDAPAVTWEQVRTSAAEAVEATWIEPNKYGEPKAALRPTITTRITDEPADDLRRYLTGITGSQPPEAREARLLERYRKRGQHTKLAQHATGGTYKSRSRRGGSYELAEDDLGEALFAGEGYTDPLVLSYAYHVARCAIQEQDARLEAQSDDVPF